MDNPPLPPRKPSPSDLTDRQWELIAPFVKAWGGGPQEQVWPRRAIVNGILYVTRTGCQWRFLPHDLPDWQSVYHYFRLWREDGTWKQIHQALWGKVRKAEGRNEAPTAAILDSQSVKTTEDAQSAGFDAGKKVQGRKRHLLVDVLGLVLLSWVTTGDVQDCDAAALALLPEAKQSYPTLEKIWVDAAYQGPLVASVARTLHLDVEVVRRSETQAGFVVQPHRWVVKRSFGWPTRDRHLAKDYERLPETSEAFIDTSFIRRMLQRLA